MRWHISRVDQLINAWISDAPQFGVFQLRCRGRRQA